MSASMAPRIDDRSASTRGRVKESGLGRWVALAGVAALAVAGVEHVWNGSEPANAAVILPPAGFGPANFAHEVQAAERQLRLSIERTDRNSDQWLPMEGLARARLARFKLTAQPADLAAAMASIEMARSLAPQGSGPMLTSAEIAMAGHDLETAEQQLDLLEQVAVTPTAVERSQAAALRGDIAFYLGDMAGAAEAYERADSILPTAGTAIRKALLARSQGRFDDAIAFVQVAAQRDTLRTPRSMAAFALQIGMIESARGNFEQAAAHYAEANRLFPGHWLTQLYLAEAKGIAGEFDDAIRIQDSIAEAMQDPQAMDAAASLHAAQGDDETALRLTERSAEIWRERAAAMPLAYTAHTFENELAFGDPQRALALARNNLSHRPYGDAHILVAEALLATDQPAEARSHLLQAEAQGWRSAPLYARLSEAEELLGNDAAAEDARETAESLNPRIFDPVMSRLWFGHG